MNESIGIHEFWVLHSPYPDGTWRGIEKCASSPDGGPLLFFSEKDALDFMTSRDGAIDPHFVAVRCTLTTPWVSKPLDSVPKETSWT